MGDYFILQILTVILIVSIITTTFNKRVLGLPQAIGVPISSAILVFLLQWAAGLLSGNNFITINISYLEEFVGKIDFYDILINGAICFILTSSAINFKVSDLKNHWKPIGILASFSLVLCAFIFGGILFGFQILINNPVPLSVLLLLGAALGATDPIGIKSVLSSVKAPHHLTIKIFGESLFNDSVCIAVFMTLLNVVNGHNFTIIGVLELLAYETIVAAIIGIVAGFSVLKLMRGENEKESLILMTALLACGSYLIALYAHASAPIACVVGGLIVGNKWEELIGKNNTKDISHFWHTVEDIINAFLFTLIGLELFILDMDFTLLLCGMVAFIILHLARFAGTYISFAFFPSLRKKRINGSLVILSWGGVRGAISLALILAVSNTEALAPYNSILVGYTFIAVLMSGVVCGLGLPAVLNAFYYNPNAPKSGFQGWYQNLCNKMNLSGVQYVVLDDENGVETIKIYEPQAEREVDGVVYLHQPSDMKNDGEDLKHAENF